MEFNLTKEQQRKESAQRRRPTHQPEPAGPLGLTPPQDTELEAAVLGALMLEKNAYPAICDIIKPACFYNTQHKLIYEAIQALGSQNHPIDMLTVTEQLRANGTIDEVGGAAYIAQLTSSVTSAANLEYHARIVSQKYIARELISYSSQIQKLAFDDSFDVLDVLQEAESKLFELSNNNAKKDFTQVSPVVDEALKKIEEASNRKSGLSGLASGFDKIDKITSGWQNSDLIIIAARPAMGKTAFVLSMAVNMAVRNDQPVAMFSLEMSNLQLVNRLISNVCELEGSKIKSGHLSNIEFAQLVNNTMQLKSAPLYIDDTPSLSVFELRTKARRLVREHGVKIIIIDYLQLMNASGMKFGSREQEVSTISRSLKQLSKELNIPIIALSQLNRNVDSRMSGEESKNKRPQLADLRESGAIEQDADIVCFIHRPEYYLHNSHDGDGKDIRGLAEFIIAKHRSGAVDTVDLRFTDKFARFDNWTDSIGVTETVTHESRMNSEEPSTSGSDMNDSPYSPPAPPDDMNFLTRSNNEPAF